MENKLQTNRIKQQNREAKDESCLSIKPCKVRIRRLVWHTAPLRHVDKTMKSSKRQHIATKIIKPQTQHCLDEKTTIKTVRLKGKRIRKSPKINISNTPKITSDCNNACNAKPSTNIMENEGTAASTASNVHDKNAAAGITTTMPAKRRITKNNKKPLRKQRTDHSLQLTKSNEKQAKSRAGKTTSDETGQKPITKYFFPSKTSNKLTEDKPKKKSSIPDGNVYEFSSQLSIRNAEACEDQSVDVIKKLINQGKVRVATRAKGKGKPILKRVTRKKRPVQKIVRFDIRTTAEIPSANRSKKIETDKNRNKTQSDNRNKSNKEELIMQAIRKTSLRSLYQHIEKNSSFSPLAQLVLRKQSINQFNQTSKTPAQAVPYSKSISTPIRNNIDPNSNLNFNISPIETSSRKSRINIPCPWSPWRVRNETNLPTIFNFNFSSDCSPSFASDSIHPLGSRSCPFGPNNLTTPVRALNVSANESKENAENSNSSLEAFVAPTTAFKSFSNLNAENVAQNRRLPLKPINILNVVDLPRWNTETISNKSKNQRMEVSKPFMNINYSSIIENASMTREIINSQKRRILGKQSSNSSSEINANNSEHFFRSESMAGKQFEHGWCSGNEIENESLESNYRIEEESSGNEEDRFLFGFEDYVNDSKQQPSREVERNRIRDKRNLHEKLSSLKRLRPQFSPASCRPATNANFPRSNIFDCNVKQKKIQQLFYNQQMNEAQKVNADKTTEEADFTAELFSNEQEMEPENINRKEIKRTYVKGGKRRSRLIEKPYIVCLASDESADEEDVCNKKSPTDAVKPSQLPKTRRRQRTKKENRELISYVKSFNAMCKEVDNFKLIVEKAKESSDVT